MNHAKPTQRGFTIIELMLAMAFVAALLLAIALTIVQLGTVYNKGMTLKEVNQTGRSISDDLRRSIGQSSSFDPATNVLSRTWGGRLCTGQVSYLWNYANAIQSNNASINRLESGNAIIRLLRVPDTSGLYCVTSGSGAFAQQRVRPVDEASSTELLREGDRTLNIHQFSIIRAPNGQDDGTGQSLYRITFTIGTGDVTALTSDRTACLPPGNVNSNFAFCAVQQFDLVTRAGNRVN